MITNKTDLAVKRCNNRIIGPKLLPQFLTRTPHFVDERVLRIFSSCNKLDFTVKRCNDGVMHPEAFA